MILVISVLSLEMKASARPTPPLTKAIRGFTLLDLLEDSELATPSLLGLAHAEKVPIRLFLYHHVQRRDEGKYRDSAMQTQQASQRPINAVS